MPENEVGRARSEPDFCQTAKNILWPKSIKIKVSRCYFGLFPTILQATIFKSISFSKNGTF